MLTSVVFAFALQQDSEDLLIHGSRMQVGVLVRQILALKTTGQLRILSHKLLI